MRIRGGGSRALSHPGTRSLGVVMNKHVIVGNAYGDGYGDGYGYSYGTIRSNSRRRS